MWEIDPANGCRAVDRRIVFDTFEAGVRIAADHGPLVDMAKLLPHTGGRTQYLVHRVRSVGMRFEEADYGGKLKLLTNDDFHATAIYYAKVHYDQSYPGTWQFASNDG